MADARDDAEPCVPWGLPAHTASNDWACWIDVLDGSFEDVGESSRFRHRLLQEETGDEEGKRDAR
ncbi:MAG: hypothetical protein H0W02_14270 [Ktedonobacteraceae bacterium]|nr:hypothetical protein [Ktedonobacteraceae bacterium]